MDNIIEKLEEFGFKNCLIDSSGEIHVPDQQMGTTNINMMTILLYDKQTLVFYKVDENDETKKEMDHNGFPIFDLEEERDITLMNGCTMRRDLFSQYNNVSKTMAKAKNSIVEQGDICFPVFRPTLVFKTLKHFLNQIDISSEIGHVFSKKALIIDDDSYITYSFSGVMGEVIKFRYIKNEVPVGEEIRLVPNNKDTPQEISEENLDGLKIFTTIIKKKLENR